jgi:uncharacterized protein YbgA (DUF1722 family)
MVILQTTALNYLMTQNILLDTLIKYKQGKKGLMLKITSVREYCQCRQCNYVSVKIFKRLWERKGRLMCEYKYR